MEIREVLERKFGKRTIYRIFDDPLELRASNPLPSDGRPFYAYVGVVEGKNWRADQLSFIEIRDAKILEGLLKDVEDFYKQRFGKKLKVAVTGSYLDTDAHILLGTRSKLIKNYLKNYQLSAS